MNQWHDDPIHLSSGQIVALLGLEKRTFLWAIARGAIRPVAGAPGGHVRFRPADGAAYARRLSLSPGARPDEA